MNEPKQTTGTQPPAAPPFQLPQARRPAYEEIKQPQPLDKKWRDDFRAGEFMLDVLTQSWGT